MSAHCADPNVGSVCKSSHFIVCRRLKIEERLCLTNHLKSDHSLYNVLNSTGISMQSVENTAVHDDATGRHAEKKGVFKCRASRR